MPDALELIADGVRAERAGALDRALESYQAAASSAVDADVRAEALTREADVHRTRCDWERGLQAARDAQEIARASQLTNRLCEAVIAEANVLLCRGDFPAAIPKFKEIGSGRLAARLRGIALQNLGSIYAQSGQSGAAERAFSESLGNFHKAGYARGEAIALNNLGRLAIDSG